MRCNAVHMHAIMDFIDIGHSEWLAAAIHVFFCWVGFIRDFADIIF